MSNRAARPGLHAARLLTPDQAAAQRAFAAAAMPAEVVTCPACEGAGGRERRGHTRMDWYECDACDGSGREVIGELPPANEAAARLESFVQAEMQCAHPDVPACALDLMTLAAAVLRGVKS